MTVGTKGQALRRAPLVIEKFGEPVILVIERDAGTRRFLCTLLRQATTLHVAEAGDPFAALSIARKNAGPIELLISDMNLSTYITGVDLARELSRTNPSMKVLLISRATCLPCEVPSTWRFLAKPFTIESFLDCVAVLCPDESSRAQRKA